jgi:raffinose/stachyose/melibiose transport system substrate-binding protein
MGTFVGANELRPLDDYAKLYNWTSYYPEQLLKLNTFSADGKKWQNGNLYGISQTGELVGVYYNKKVLSQLGVKPPVTLSDLESDMAAAKAAGLTPMTYGDVEKSPGIHLYGIVQAALAGQKAVTDLVSGTSGAWTDSPNVQAAQTLTDWSNKGYIPDGANGISRSAALANFGKGGAAFTITGTWRAAELSTALGNDVGFTALAPAGSKSPVTTGGEGLAWAVTTGTKNPDVAAAYLDFVTNAASAQVLIDSANLPAVLPKGYSPAPGTVAADVAAAYTSISANNGLVPYLDYSTPTFYGTLTGAVQELTAKQIAPDQFSSTLQADYSAFLKENK